MAGRTYKTEAIVLRSLRFSEADRILHLYTLDRGRIGAIAKGVRKTKSRFGARLEPLSHVELVLHEGSGELHTVTGVELIGSHHAARENGYRLSVGLTGAEAMLRLFAEPEANPRAFTALARFLELPLDAEPVVEQDRHHRARSARALLPAQAALGLRLPAARDRVCRVWCEDGPGRLLGARGRLSCASSHARGSFGLSPEASPASSSSSRRRSPPPPG